MDKKLNLIKRTYYDSLSCWTQYDTLDNSSQIDIFKGCLFNLSFKTNNPIYIIDLLLKNRILKFYVDIYEIDSQFIELPFLEFAKKPFSIGIFHDWNGILKIIFHPVGQPDIYDLFVSISEEIENFYESYNLICDIDDPKWKTFSWGNNNEIYIRLNFRCKYFVMEWRVPLNKKV